MKLKDLWQWSGRISRAPFVIWGLILFALKYNLDRVLVYWLFGRQWSVFSYFQQPLPGIENLSPAQSPSELIILLAASLPFLWAGVMLCIKRLRSAQLPLWLAVLFVAPIVKWFLFVALALVPGRNKDLKKPSPSTLWLPKSVFGSAALAVGASVLLAVAAMILSTVVLRDYGWGLFAGVPFTMGFFSALIYGAREPRRLRESLAVAIVSVFIAGSLLLVLAFEGVICLLMATPLAFILAVIGAVAGHVVQASRRPRVPAQLYCIPVLALPLMFASEMLRPSPPPLLKVVSSVEVNAPVETVWKHVVEFSQLPPPTEFVFKLGIAYPIRAEITGHGPGAVRNCIFSTGRFVEPIEVWDEPHLLKFSVASNPAPLEEWTLYREIHPPHLKGFLVSEQGQFQLTPLPGGRTLLEGTTWYHHTMWPVAYWQIWSNQIIHTIHRRVLLHVKALSEQRRPPEII
jgi:uncharacterized membrane protein YhaH (DUF805 family)